MEGVYAVYPGVEPPSRRAEIWIGYNFQVGVLALVESRGRRVVAVCRGGVESLGLKPVDIGCGCVLSSGLVRAIGGGRVGSVRVQPIEVSEDGIKDAVFVGISQFVKDVEDDTEVNNVSFVLTEKAIALCLEGTTVTMNASVAMDWLGDIRTTTVLDTMPEGPVSITAATRVRIVGGRPPTGWTDGWTLSVQEQKLMELVNGCHSCRGTERGVLVTGPSGSGKTYMCQKVLKASSCPVYELSMVDLLRAESGNGERIIRATFGKAIATAPSSIFLEGIDSIRGDARLNTALFAALDCLHQDRSVAVVFLATAVSMNTVDSRFHRPSRLYLNLKLRSPSILDRKAILTERLQPYFSTDAELQNISDDVAKRTPGFLPADLDRVFSVSLLAATKRLRTAQTRDLILLPDDLRRACLEVTPGVLTSCPWWRAVPEVDQSPLYGVDDEEKLLMGCVRLALLDSKKSPVGYVRGALISGPSGCGKTCLVRRVAQYFASEVNLVSASAAEVLSSTPGATERAIRQLFTFARAAAPTILVLENIEVLSPSRDGQNHSNNPFRRVLTTLLTQLDGMDTSEEHGGIFVLATTRRGDDIDSALLRPGRIEVAIALSELDETSVGAILQEELAFTPTEPYVDMLVGRTGAYVRGICREVKLRCFRRGGQEPTLEDLHDVLDIRDRIGFRRGSE